MSRRISRGNEPIGLFHLALDDQGPLVGLSRYHGHMDESGYPEEEAPLGDDEREALQNDLVDVESLKALLSQRGIKGAVFYCPDCDEDHYLGWDLLAGNLQELLEQGESPMHEPAFDPDPNEYVSWDYARGLLDGYENFSDEALGEVADQLAVELTARGWPAADIKALLVRLDLPAAVEEGQEPIA